MLGGRAEEEDDDDDVHAALAPLAAAFAVLGVVLVALVFALSFSTAFTVPDFPELAFHVAVGVYDSFSPPSPATTVLPVASSTSF